MQTDSICKIDTKAKQKVKEYTIISPTTVFLNLELASSVTLEVVSSGTHRTPRPLFHGSKTTNVTQVAIGGSAWSPKWAFHMFKAV